MRLLRFAPLAVGLVFAAVAVGMWRAGEPPAWSLVAPRGEGRVVTSRIDVSPRGNGTLRHDAVVEVDAGDGVVVLLGTRPTSSEASEPEARAIVDAWPVGATVPTRLVGGVVHADRTDAFQLALALFMSAVDAFVLCVGLLVAGVPLRLVGRGLARPRGGTPAS